MNQQRHRCHASGCNRYVSVRMLMCPFHWKLVPRPIQCRVWEAFRAWEAGGAIELLRAVQAEAVAAVREG